MGFECHIEAIFNYNIINNWSLRTMREKLVKIGAKVVSHAGYVTFQMAEVLVSKSLFHEILERIRLRGYPLDSRRHNM